MDDDMMTRTVILALGLFAAVQLAIVVGFVLTSSLVKSRSVQAKAA